MGRSWPAVDVRGFDDPDLILAAADDFSPTAVEDHERSLRIFFADTSQRDAARDALASRFEVHALDVPDDDWARRSQQNLAPVTVGRITVFSNPESRIPNPDSIAIVIAPSMGFGTGHHATTRLCLAALQTLDLAGASVLDAGTGSGVLAIAAARLGASPAVGIDCDPDAIQAARENLALNPEARYVSFEVADLTATVLPSADVVTANLTGALLVRAATPLCRAVNPGGTLMLGGLLAEEREAVRDAFGQLDLAWERQEEEWLALTFHGARPLHPLQGRADRDKTMTINRRAPYQV